MHILVMGNKATLLWYIYGTSMVKEKFLKYKKIISDKQKQISGSTCNYFFIWNAIA